MRAILLWVGMAVTACHGHDQAHADKAPGSRRIQIVYDIDLDKAVDDRASDVKHDLEAQLVEQKIDARVRLLAMTIGTVAIVPADPAKRSALEALIKTTYGSTLAARDCPPPADPDPLCFELAGAGAIKKAALDRAAATVRARVVAFGVSDANVSTKGDQIVVDLPGLGSEKLAGLQDVVARTAALAFKVVDNNSELMKRLFAHVGSAGKSGSATDPDATAADIQADVDEWRPDDGGPAQVDYYLIARDREAAVTPHQAKQLHCMRAENCLITGRMAIERYVHELARKDPSFAVPDDRQLVYERVEPAPDAKDRRPAWRSYYVERTAALTGASITNATATQDPAPAVLLEFDRDGTHAFADLTTRIAGKKLATILDGTVRSAPVINGPIRGGRASITLGRGADDHAAGELALVLKLGALPAPLVEASMTEH